VRKQIKRLSPHQNGKVFAVLMTISAILIFIPMAIMIYFAGPQVDQNGNPVELPIFMFAIMPIFYLVFGYIFAATGCAIYNFVYRFLGGFEFEIEEKSV
jgi:hypothetical protein